MKKMTIKVKKEEVHFGDECTSSFLTKTQRVCMHHYHHMQDNLQEDVTVRLFLLQQDLAQMDT